MIEIRKYAFPKIVITFYMAGKVHMSDGRDTKSVSKKLAVGTFLFVALSVFMLYK